MRFAAALAALALFAQASDDAPRPVPQDFRYMRTLTRGSTTGARTCATVPGDLYAHSPTLADVRVYAGGRELPYALTSSETTTQGDDAARVVNAGELGNHLVFDLVMPARTYSDVDLKLTGQDFLATARVTGLKSLYDSAGTSLGTFTLFDLSSQRLGRSASLPLAETSFAVLHVELDIAGVQGHPAPAVTVNAANVPPSRAAQTLYTVVAQTTQLVEQGRDSVATLSVPAHVPVEHLSFVLGAGQHANFSRPVELSARPAAADASANGDEPEVIDGNISRVRLTLNDRELHSEALGFDATLGANGQHPAVVRVAVRNGDDRPLAIDAVRLEMRERQLCFDAPATAGPIALYDGDTAAAAPVYDYARLFVPGSPAQPAVLGPEQPNPGYVAHAEPRPFTERHPQLLWLALIAMVGSLGAVAFRSAKKI